MNNYINKIAMMINEESDNHKLTEKWLSLLNYDPGYHNLDSNNYIKKQVVWDLAMADPSSDYKFVPWLISQFNNGQIIVKEVEEDGQVILGLGFKVNHERTPVGFQLTQYIKKLLDGYLYGTFGQDNIDKCDIKKFVVADHTGNKHI